MSDAKTKTNLEINLRRAEGSGALEPSSNLFEKEMSVVIAWANKHREVMAAQRGDNKRHQHDAILISGPRGSGKTTFMYTLKERISKHAEMGHSVALLEPLDPSLIDGDDIFLATIIATIYRHLKIANKTENSNVQETLKQLGAAMIALDKTASRQKLHEVANTPSLFGERLLHSALSSLDVAERFKRFTHAAAEALNVKFFALFLDDVDTAFKQGAQVLETVRRYCVDGVVLPIISGNLDLFRLVLRERVWKDLESLNRSETNDKMKEKIFAQVTELEGQYLLKVLRPERRMKLPAPRARLDEFEHVTLTHADKNTHARLKWLLYRLNHEVFNAPISTKTTTTLPSPASALFTDNTRQIRSVLAWIGEVLAGEFVSQTDLTNQNGIPTAPKALEGLDVSKILDLHPRIRETQLTEDILAAIAEGNFQPLSLWICSHLDRYATLFRLDPTELGEREDDEPWRIATLAVHAALVRRWRAHPEDQLVYLGSVLAPAVALANLNTKATKNSESIEREIVIPTSWQLGQKAPAWHTTARVTASRNVNFQRSREAYYLKLRKRSPKNADDVWTHYTKLVGQKKGDHGIKKWLEIVGPDASQKDKNVRYPSVVAWRKYVGDRAECLLDWYTICLRYYNSTMDVIDPWSGFIAISELLKFHATHENRNTEDYRSKTLRMMTDFGQNIVFGIPAFLTGTDQVDESTDDDVDSEAKSPHNSKQVNDVPLEDTELGKLRDQINTWLCFCDALNSGYTLPPPMLSILAERFTQNQIAIYNEYEAKDWTVGHMLQSWTLAWLNSCLLADGAYCEIDKFSEKNLVSTRLKEEIDDSSQIQILRNLSATLSHAHSNKNEGKPATPPRTFLTFATCPLIFGLLSDEWAKKIHFYCKKIVESSNLDTQDFAWLTIDNNQSAFNLNLATSGSQEISQNKNTYAAHDLLCALVTPPSITAAANAKGGAKS